MIEWFERLCNGSCGDGSGQGQLNSTKPSICGMGDGGGVLIGSFSRCEMYLSAPEGQTYFATGHGACCDLVEEMEVQSERWI